MTTIAPNGAATSLAAEPRTLLVSIHVRYAEGILRGSKTVELRRRFGNADGAKLLIYATTPMAAVVGHVLVDRVDRLPVCEIWSRHSPHASVSQEDFNRYFAGVDRGCAIILGRATRYDTPIPLAELRSRHGLDAPQSYVVLREEHRRLIEHEQD